MLWLIRSYWFATTVESDSVNPVRTVSRASSSVTRIALIAVNFQKGGLMKQRKRLMILTIMALITGLFLYNYWSYSYGRCTMNSFLALSSPAVILLLCNIVAFLFLCAVKTRNNKRYISQHCSCGNILHSNWQFCPSCGSSSRHSNST